MVPKPKHWHSYSQCYDEAGNPYHLVVMWDRHPSLTGEPLRVHGISHISKERAHAAALEAWDHTYTSLRARPPVRRASVT